jgi:hypothetical protein
MQSVLRKRVEGIDIPAVVHEARQAFRERPCTFAELRDHLIQKFPGRDERAMGFAVRTHLALIAVPDKSEWSYRSDPAFADAEDWLQSQIVPDASTDDLILRYLAAFGPATASDFQTWSGIAKARENFTRLRPRLRIFQDDRGRELFDLPDAPRPSEDTSVPARFLPGFDNIILSHTDRSRIIADEHRPRVTTKNLLVLPTFLINGFVAGTWTCTRRKAEAILSMSPFATLSKVAKQSLQQEAEDLVRFLEPEARTFAVTVHAV